MYYHPLILTEAQKQHRLAAFQDFARIWLDGIDRQRRLHADAISELCASQQEGLRVLFEAIDITHFLVRWTARAVPVSLLMLQASMRAGEIAANVKRQIAVLADHHAKEHSRNTPKQGANGGGPVRHYLSNRGKSRNRQMMA